MLRIALGRHRWLAALVLAAALLLRVAVPAGYMPVMSAHGVTLVLCPGQAPVRARPAMHHAMPGMSHDMPDDSHHADYQNRCAFADLALPLIGGADAVLLAAAIAFVMARALRPARTLPPRPAPYLLPPSRGPPLPA